MPAMAVRLTGDGNRNEPAFAFETPEVEKAGALAEAPVGLLQGDHVGIDLGDHRRGAFRVETFVAPDAFVNVVGGDEQVGRCALVPQRARPSRAGRNAERIRSETARRLVSVSISFPDCEQRTKASGYPISRATDQVVIRHPTAITYGCCAGLYHGFHAASMSDPAGLGFCLQDKPLTPSFCLPRVYSSSHILKTAWIPSWIARWPAST